MRLVIHAAAGVPGGDLSKIEALVDVGELQVALENLCTQVFEYGVVLGADARQTIRELAPANLGSPRGIGDCWTARSAPVAAVAALG